MFRNRQNFFHRVVAAGTGCKQISAFMQLVMKHVLTVPQNRKLNVLSNKLKLPYSQAAFNSFFFGGGRDLSVDKLGSLLICFPRKQLQRVMVVMAFSPRSPQPCLAAPWLTSSLHTPNASFSPGEFSQHLKEARPSEGWNLCLDCLAPVL